MGDSKSSSVVTVERARVLLTKAREAHHSTPKAVSSPKLPSAGLCSAVPFASTNSFPLLSLFLFSVFVLEGNGIIAVHCIVLAIILSITDRPLSPLLVSFEPSSLYPPRLSIYLRYSV